MLKIVDLGAGVVAAWTKNMLATHPDSHIYTVDKGNTLARAKEHLVNNGYDMSRITLLDSFASELPIVDNDIDIIQARFFFSVVDSIQPHCLDEVMREAHRILKPSGILEVSDYGPLNKPKTAVESVQAELWRFDKLVSLWLNGAIPLVEYPYELIQSKIIHSGFNVKEVTTYPAHWDLKWLDEYQSNITISLNRFPSEMRNGLIARFDTLCTSARSCIHQYGDITNGYTYHMVCEKM